MNFQELKYKANYYVLILLAFVIPLERKFAPPIIALFLITSLVNGGFKRRLNYKVLLFSSIFLLYIIGLFYGENLGFGVKNLIEKLSLLVFPLAFYFSKINFKNQLSSILVAFVEGCFVSGIISVVVSFLGFYFALDTSLFFYANSSHFLHPSYFAMYANFAILIIYFNVIFRNPKASLKKVSLSFLLLLFFSILIILSASKTGVITLIITHFIALSFWMFIGKRYFKGLLVLTLISVIFTGVFSLSSTIQNRVNEMVLVVFSGDTSSGSTTAARSEIWKISTKLISEKPFLGYGIGNETSALVKLYNENGFVNFAEKQLNAHNQFLQTSIAIGIVGGLVLLLVLLFPLYFSIRKHHYLYAGFIGLVLFNFLTESMLERQAGVVFYSLFNALFFVVYFEKDGNESLIKS